MPKPETLAWLRHAATAGDATSQALLEALERLERLEAARPAAEPTDEADAPQTLHTIALRMVDSLERGVGVLPGVLPEICDTLRRAIREPAVADLVSERLRYCPTHGQQPPNAWGCPECMRELRQGARGHEPINPVLERKADRPAAEPIGDAEMVDEARASMRQPPAGLSLLDELAVAIGGQYEYLRPVQWRPEARRAVAVIVRRLRERSPNGSSGITADWLEKEAAK